MNNGTHQVSLVFVDSFAVFTGKSSTLIPHSHQLVPLIGGRLHSNSYFYFMQYNLKLEN